MSEAWGPRALSSLARYVNGFAFKPEHWGDEGLPIVRIEQLNNPDGNYDYCSVAVPSDNLIDDGDLIFSWSATLKVAFWRRGKAALNQHLFKVIPEPDVDQTFLFQLLDYHMEALAGGAHGSTMKHIKRSELDRFVVEIPKKNVQTLLASVLGALDAQIEATEALIAKQERLRAGLMQDLFTRGVDENGELRPPQEKAPYLYYETELGYLPKAWSVDSFGSCIDVIDPNPSHRYPNPVEEGVPICSTENFDGEEGFNLERAQHVPTDTFTFQNSRCRFHQNDVVFARKGRIGLARRYGKNHMVFSHTIVTMKPSTENLDQLWLLWLARSGHFLDGIRREMNSNSGVPTLGIEFIKSIKVPFPEKHEQERMALLLDKATYSLEGAKADKTKLKRQKLGLMQDLLTGAVSVEPLLESEPA